MSTEAVRRYTLGYNVAGWWREKCKLSAAESTLDTGRAFRQLAGEVDQRVANKNWKIKKSQKNYRMGTECLNNVNARKGVEYHDVSSVLPIVTSVHKLSLCKPKLMVH